MKKKKQIQEQNHMRENAQCIVALMKVCYLVMLCTLLHDLSKQDLKMFLSIESITFSICKIYNIMLNKFLGMKILKYITSLNSHIVGLYESDPHPHHHPPLPTQPYFEIRLVRCNMN